jgi:hypothetical protein
MNDTVSKICKPYKIHPTIMSKVKRIVVLGDIHGDYEYAICLLKLGGLIEIDGDNIKWIGNDTYVVQIGDQIDNCRPPLNDKTFCNVRPNAVKVDEASDIKIMELFNELSLMAEKDGGKVISLLGNHEMLNLMGDMSYVSYANIKSMEKDNILGIDIRRKEFGKHGEIRKMIGCTRMASVIIGSNLFVHGGIIDAYIDDMNISGPNDLSVINNAIRNWLLELPHDKSYVRKIIKKNDTSIFWNRILGSIPPRLSIDDKRCSLYIGKTLKLFNIGHMIIGHTPQSFTFEPSEGINKTCGDEIFRVDHAGSKTFNIFEKSGKIKEREPQILEIIDDNIFRVCNKDGCHEI